MKRPAMSKSVLKRDRPDVPRSEPRVGDKLAKYARPTLPVNQKTHTKAKK